MNLDFQNQTNILQESPIDMALKQKLNIAEITPIHKGWSCDQKYCITTTDGEKYLLRITPQDKSATRKDLFKILHQVAALKIPMCKPVDFGTCSTGVYLLTTWIEGEDLAEVLLMLSETEQYALGMKAGQILKQLHTIPAPSEQEDWASHFNRKTNRKIQKYHECGLRFHGDDSIIAYIEQHRDLLKDRPQCFQHGDYHIGNMMLENGDLVIIDFDRFDFGDPWEEFNRIVWCAQKSPHFATGMVKGYFDGAPPMEFWQLLAFYIGSNALSSIYWAIPFGQSEVDIMMQQSQEILSWYNNMQNVIPRWYLKDFYIQWIDGIPYKLKSPYDFSFLHPYGKVFKVFDDQDSGNICFGIHSIDGNRYFIKFAGAPTDRSNVRIDVAISNLKRTLPIYKDLTHPNLIKLVDAKDIIGGFAIIFEWVDAECMGLMYPLSRKRFMQTTMETRLQIFDAILSFFAHIAEKGYVGIDFYDGSILYDFINLRTVICDIDFFSKTPYVNEMGRMWGSSRFMSPEEYIIGADIDEITNVYTLGATAFALFGDERDRCLEKWQLNETLFHVAKRAVSENRMERQYSIQQLKIEWEAAKKW